MSLLGKFVLFGNPTGLTRTSGVAKVDAKMKGLSLSDSMRVGDARDGNGRIFASNVERDSHVITVDFIPFDSTGTSLATAIANTKLPGPGVVVTLSDFGNNLIDGDWNYIGDGSVEPGATKEEPIMIRGLKLRRVSTDGSTVGVQAVMS